MISNNLGIRTFSKGVVPFRLFPFRLFPFRLIPFRLFPFRLLPFRLNHKRTVSPNSSDIFQYFYFILFHLLLLFYFIFFFCFYLILFLLLFYFTEHSALFYIHLKKINDFIYYKVQSLKKYIKILLKQLSTSMSNQALL